ncbi:MORN repeat-containing protein [Leptospira sp. WS92.C1]
MNVGRSDFISYSKIMILLQTYIKTKSNPSVRTLKQNPSIGLPSFLVMFLFLLSNCSGGNLKTEPNESANRVESSTYIEDKKTEREAETTDVSDRSETPDSKDGKGCIEGNCTTGNGTFVYDNGDEYKGGFLDDMRNGSGKIRYTNGDKFDGIFKDDLKDGKGTYVFKNGAILEGTFQAGSLIGPGKVRFPDTSIYEGEFQDEKNSSEGTLSSTRDGSKRNCKIENKIVLCGGPSGNTGNIKPLH